MPDSIKKFTQNKIAERITRNFLRRENLRESLNDSAIQSMIQAIAEEFAEGMRYDEYLTRENVWDYMRNVTSAVGTASMLGYTPRRKRSAVTTLVFAVDPNVTRLGAFEPETYNEILASDDEVDALRVEGDVVSLRNLRSLRHFDNAGTDPQIEIPINTVIKDEDSDVRFITLESVTLRTADNLRLDQDPDEEVTSRWARVRSIQGVKRTQMARGVRGRDFETVSINSRFVEDMGMPYSENFLEVKVREVGGSEFEPWSYVSDIREANPYDRVFTVETARDYSRVDIVFGNGFSGRRIPRGTDVEINYLETKGSEGNIDGAHRVTDIRTTIEPQVPGVQLYVTNSSPIVNGADEDTIEDIKARAPRHYLTVDSVGSRRAYRETILALPEIRNARVYRGVYRNNQEGVFRDTVSFTAITEDGAIPRSNEIVRRVRESIGEGASPTDILQFDPPEVVKISYNIRGTIDDVTRPLQFFTNEIRRALYNKYRVREMDFKDPIFHIDVMNTMKEAVPELESAFAFPEAIITRDFFRDEFLLGDEGALRIDFNFRQALTPFREIRHNVQYVLRIDFIVDYEPLRHRSRSILLVPNPNEPEGDDDEFVIRQFDLLGDTVMTPDRSRAVLQDASDTFGEKTETVWNWINRTELTQGDPEDDDPEDFDFYYDDPDNYEGLTFSESFQLTLDSFLEQDYKIIEERDSDGEKTGIVFFYYSQAVNLNEMDEDRVLEYYNRYRNWEENSQWAQDPDVAAAIIEEDYIGRVPTLYAPDDTHRAPIEVTFLPSSDRGGERAGGGTIFIRPEANGIPVEFIPDTSYRGAEEDDDIAQIELQVMAQPRSLDLTLEEEYEIFNLEQRNIKLDLRYRTEEGDQFQTATDFEELEDED